MDQVFKHLSLWMPSLFKPPQLLGQHDRQQVADSRHESQREQAEGSHFEPQVWTREGN